MLVLRNCSFIEALTEGTELKKGDVIVDNEIIKEIAPCGTTIAGEYEEIDLAGATLMPGLVDMHVHLHSVGPTFAELSLMNHYTRLFNAIEYAQFLMSIGYTTVRNAGDIRYYPGIGTKRAIEAGVVEGPRLTVSGLTICPTDICDADFTGMGISARFDGVHEMRKVVREDFMNDADYIKLYGTGSMMIQGSDPDRRIIEEDEILEAVKIAYGKGSYCAMHCHGAEAIDLAVRCGVHTIEHASFISDATLKRLDGRTDIGLVMTLSILIENHIVDETKLRLKPDCPEHIRERVSRMVTCLKNAYQYDVLVGWGTDIDLDRYRLYPGGEFRMRKELLGFENIDILKQATINSAKLLYQDDRVGSIKVGKYADLIVVNGDPVQDIGVMYTPPAMVFKGGKKVR